MIAIVDYGMGNLGSIANMLVRIGAEVQVSSDHSVVRKADRIILPGVGSFDLAMRNLRDSGMFDLLNERVLGNKIPILGICLGMQIMTKGSEEGSLPGLGWVDADTIRFPFRSQQEPRVPHMGWNTVSVRSGPTILTDLPPDARFYFVHSYYVRCRDPETVIGTTSYGISFDSAFQSGCVTGTQFHPEKSHRFGMKVLANFAEG